MLNVLAGSYERNEATNVNEHATVKPQPGALETLRSQAQHASNIGDVSHAVYFGNEALLLVLSQIQRELSELRVVVGRR